MNTFVQAIADESTKTLTENGAPTYTSSLNPVLDMFFLLGGKRGARYEAICKIIDPAFAANPELAARVALYNRDILQGQGERQIYRHIIRYLCQNSRFQDIVLRLMRSTLRLGRADDLFVFTKFGNATVRTATLDHIAEELRAGNGLMAKWMPRKGPVFNLVRHHMNLSPKQFRRLIVDLTNVVETKMCERRWTEIDFSTVPSKAMSIYSKAFKRHAPEEYESYITSVETGKVNVKTGKVEKINAKAVYPYEIISMSDERTGQQLWENLPDFVPEGVSFIPVIDTSGSMEALIDQGSNRGAVACIDVAASLGIYLAERNKGPFKDLWINFHSNPKFRMLQGTTVYQKLKSLDFSDWGGSTNLMKAMQLIADVAIKNNVDPADMPKFLIVISDMEFNDHGYGSHMEMIKNVFNQHGYEVPNIIWWNVQSRNNTVPVRFDTRGTALVSGCSPSIMKQVLSGECNPQSMMLNTIMQDRYNF